MVVVAVILVLTSASDELRFCCFCCLFVCLGCLGCLGCVVDERGWGG